MVNARQRPIVTVGDERLPDSLEIGANVIALGGLSIDWGREDVYAEVDPAELALEVLDTTGLWSTDPSRYGEEITVSLPNGRILFRGAITDTAMRSEARILWGREETIWRTTLHAVDVLADLARDTIRNGTETIMRVVVPEPSAVPGGASTTIWNAYNLVTMLKAPGASGIGQYVANITNPPSLPTDGYLFGAATQNAIPTWLELLYAVWRAVPLAVVAYDPETDSLVGTEPASRTGIGIELQFVLEQITLAPYRVGAGKAPVSLPSGRLELDGIELVSTIQTAITSIEISHRFVHREYHPILNNGWHFPIGFWRNMKTVTAAVPGARIARTLALTLQIVPTPPTAPPSLPPGTEIPEIADVPTGPPITSIGEAWANVARQINGQIAPPDVRYQFERWPEDPELEQFLLRTRADATPVFLPGSITSSIPNVPYVLEIIGGRLFWDDGWIVTMHFAPTVGTSSAGTLAINQLVTIPAPRLEDFDPSITLADLGNVTRGIS